MAMDTEAGYVMFMKVGCARVFIPTVISVDFDRKLSKFWANANVPIVAVFEKASVIQLLMEQREPGAMLPRLWNAC